MLVTAMLLRKEAPDLPIVALVRSPSSRDALRELGVERSELVPGIVYEGLFVLGGR